VKTEINYDVIWAVKKVRIADIILVSKKNKKKKGRWGWGGKETCPAGWRGRRKGRHPLKKMESTKATRSKGRGMGEGEDIGEVSTRGGGGKALQKGQKYHK